MCEHIYIYTYIHIYIYISMYNSNDKLNHEYTVNRRALRIFIYAKIIRVGMFMICLADEI